MSASVPRWLRRRVCRHRITKRGLLALNQLKEETGLEACEIVDAALRVANKDRVEFIVNEDVNEVLGWQQL